MLPCSIIDRCKDANDLHRIVMENHGVFVCNRLVFPLNEVISEIIEEDRFLVVTEIANALLGHEALPNLHNKIRQVIEYNLAEYLCEEIHYEARRLGQEAVDELYHAYEPA